MGFVHVQRLVPSFSNGKTLATMFLGCNGVACLCTLDEISTSQVLSKTTQVGTSTPSSSLVCQPLVLLAFCWQNICCFTVVPAGQKMQMDKAQLSRLGLKRKFEHKGWC